MRLAFYILGLCLVVATAFWSYRVTYGTQGLLDQTAELRRDIAREREAISVLEAEWAWLNAPDRLERLVREHGDRLRLAPMAPDRFADIDEIPEPVVDDGMEPVALIDLDGAIEGVAFAPPPAPRPMRRR